MYTGNGPSNRKIQQSRVKGKNKKGYEIRMQESRYNKWRQNLHNRIKHVDGAMI
jgi:hypothetical protein